MKLYTLFFFSIIITSQVIGQGFENKAFLVLKNAVEGADFEIESDTSEGISSQTGAAAAQLIRIEHRSEGLVYTKRYAPNVGLSRNKTIGLSRDSNLVIHAQWYPDIGKAFPPHQIMAYHPETLEPLDSISLSSNPLALSVHPAGEFIATVVDSVGAEIAITRIKDGKFGQTFYFPTGVQTSIRIRATNVEWHPSGQYLAITLEETSMVVFYKLSLLGTRPVIQMNNNPLKLGELPETGHFTPDGKHFLLTDSNHRREPGRLLAIRCDFRQGGKHGLVAYAGVGVDPESFAISPDGKKVVVVNLESTHLTYIKPETQEEKSTLQLFDRDSASGKLKLLSTLPYNGVLPTGVQFSEDQLMIAVLAYTTLGKEQGAIDFFSIEGDQLIAKPDLQIPLPKGPHAMIILDNN